MCKEFQIETMSDKTYNDLAGRILLLDFLLKNFTEENGEYIFETNKLEPKDFLLLTSSLPYIFNKEEWVANRVFDKKELLELKDKLCKELIEYCNKAEGE